MIKALEVNELEVVLGGAEWKCDVRVDVGFMVPPIQVKVGCEVSFGGSTSGGSTSNTSGGGGGGGGSGASYTMM